MDKVRGEDLHNFSRLLKTFLLTKFVQFLVKGGKTVLYKTSFAL